MLRSISPFDATHGTQNANATSPTPPQAPCASIPDAKRSFHGPQKRDGNTPSSLVGRIHVPAARNAADTAASTSQRFIDNRHFGDWLSDLAHAMQAQKVAQVDATLIALDKPMAVSLRWKADEASRIARICVTCCDLQLTAKNRRRIEAGSAQELRGRTLTECFPNAVKYSLSEGQAWTSASWQGVPLDSPNELQYFDMRPYSIADGVVALSLALEIGSPSLVEALGTHLRGAGRASGLDLTAFRLHATARLFAALKSGNAEMVRACAAALKEIDLPRDVLFTVIEARFGEEAGLSCAMMLGHEEAIRAYGALLELPGLNHRDDKLALVLAKHPRTVSPALFDAADRMQPASIKAYGDLLYTLGFRGMSEAELRETNKEAELREANEANAFKLLRGLSARGTPALHRIFDRGCAKSLLAYCRVLKQLEIPMHQVLDLLSARERTGTPAVFRACATADAGMIRAFGAGLRHLGVPRQEAIRLLYAELPPALHDRYGASSGYSVAMSVSAPSEFRDAYVAVLDHFSALD